MRSGIFAFDRRSYRESGSVVSFLFGFENFTGLGVDFVVVFVFTGFKADLVDISAVILIEFNGDVACVRCFDACVAERRGCRLVFADVAVGAYRTVVIVIIVIDTFFVGVEDFAGFCVDFVVILIAVCGEVNFIVYTAVIAVKLGFFEACVCCFDACMTESCGFRFVFADIFRGGSRGFVSGVRFYRSRAVIIVVIGSLR